MANSLIQNQYVSYSPPKSKVLSMDPVDLCGDDIFERLSNYDYQRAYRRRANYKLENTTKWILKHPDFVAWLGDDAEHPGPNCLWLSGIGELM